MHRRILAAVQRDAALRHLLVRAVALAREQQCIGTLAIFRQQQHQPLRDDAGNAFAQTNVGHQFGPGLAAGKAQQLVPDGGMLLGARQLLHAFGAQRLGQQPFAQISRLILRQGFHIVADLRAGASGAHKGQPGGVGFGVVGGDDLHHVAVLEFRA